LRCAEPCATGAMHDPEWSHVRAVSAQPEQKQQLIVRELFATLTARAETASSFIDASKWFEPGVRIIYRQYATLYFCMVIDHSESELGILDLVQVLVETLDRHFKSVCELDIIFNSPQARVPSDGVGGQQ
jgi:AP-3 complex subunit sigma